MLERSWVYSDGVLHQYIFVISHLWLTSHPRSTLYSCLAQWLEHSISNRGVASSSLPISICVLFVPFSGNDRPWILQHCVPNEIGDLEGFRFCKAETSIFGNKIKWECRWLDSNSQSLGYKLVPGVPASSRTTVLLGREVNHSWEMINI